MEVTGVFELLQVPPTRLVVKEGSLAVPRDWGVVFVPGSKGRSRPANRCGGTGRGGTRSSLAKGCLLQPPVTSAKPSSIPQAPQPPKCLAFPPGSFSLAFSSCCRLTRQVSLVTVHSRAPLLQPKAPPTDPPQTQLAPPWTFCGCWTLTAGRVRWVPFYPMHEALPCWPTSIRDHPSLGTAADPPTCCKKSGAGWPPHHPLAGHKPHPTLQALSPPPASQCQP